MADSARSSGGDGSQDEALDNGSNSSGAIWDGKDPDQEVLVGFNIVDYDFVETVGIEILESRGFSRDFPGDEAADSTGGWLINESLADIIGKENIVGERFSFLGVDGRIVGLMKDFHFLSARTEIGPLAMVLAPGEMTYILVKIQGTDTSRALAQIEETWERIVPEYPFESPFIDEDIDSMYRGESSTGKLINYFAVIIVFIACLGLFGLSSYTAEQRRQEIGIRKAIGATSGGIVMLLSREFAGLVIISIGVGIPLAYYLMNGWLEDFAYRIEIKISVLIISGLPGLAIALITVSYQSVRAALANPIDALRY